MWGFSGKVGLPFSASGGSTSTSRAVPPNAGNNGANSYVLYGCDSSFTAVGGGGGGFVFPGTGGTYDVDLDIFGGGGAGGSGAAVSNNAYAYNNNGGSANNAAPSYTTFGDAYQGGGGGGWGAAGAASYTNTSLYQVGATGGNSIVTNGNAYTLTGSGTLYGSVNTALRSVVYTFPTTVETGTSLQLDSIPGYTAGNNVVLIVPANVRLTSSIGTDALSIGLTSAPNNPSSIRLIINGAIYGTGGSGGSETSAPVSGGRALGLTTNIATNLIIENTNGYIAGGGGGGGRSVTTGTVRNLYGGGGAGLEGASGAVGDVAYNPGVTSGVSAGNNGTVNGAATYASGGSGGTILPGAKTNNPTLPAVGTYAGLGGQAGGSGAFHVITAGIASPNNYGGEFGVGGGSGSSNSITQPGGGGGWGGSGGAGRRGATVVQTGAGGGQAIRTASSTAVFIMNPTNLAGAVAII